MPSSKHSRQLENILQERIYAQERSLQQRIAQARANDAQQIADLQSRVAQLESALHKSQVTERTATEDREFLVERILGLSERVGRTMKERDEARQEALLLRQKCDVNNNISSKDNNMSLQRASNENKIVVIKRNPKTIMSQCGSDDHHFDQNGEYYFYGADFDSSDF